MIHGSKSVYRNKEELDPSFTPVPTYCLWLLVTTKAEQNSHRGDFTVPKD